MGKKEALVAVLFLLSFRNQLVPSGDTQNICNMNDNSNSESTFHIPEEKPDFLLIRINRESKSVRPQQAHTVSVCLPRSSATGEPVFVLSLQYFPLFSNIDLTYWNVSLATPKQVSLGTGNSGSKDVLNETGIFMTYFSLYIPSCHSQLSLTPKPTSHHQF